MNDKPGTKWYAIYTKSRTEKKTASELVKKGFEVYLPLQKTIRQWSDRKKSIELPLLPSYLFIKISMCDYFNALNTKGVVRFISFSGKPAPIPAWQINNLKILITSDERFEIISDHFKIGEQVFVYKGSLRGLKGTIIEHRSKCKVLIHIDSIEKDILVNIHPALLKKEKIEKAI
jgi:transcriptional antiterminator RfaH